jgi:DNA-binding Lrp family transcriptional regulator
MTPAQWALSRRILSLLAADPGVTDSDLAERLGVTVAELRAPIGMLLGRGKIERAGDYLVLAPTRGAA